MEISGSPSADGGFCWQQTKLKIRLAWSWNAENEVQKKDQYIYKSFRTKCVFVSVLGAGSLGGHTDTQTHTHTDTHTHTHTHTHAHTRTHTHAHTHVHMHNTILNMISKCFNSLTCKLINAHPGRPNLGLRSKNCSGHGSKTTACENVSSCPW